MCWTRPKVDEMCDIPVEYTVYIPHSCILPKMQHLWYRACVSWWGIESKAVKDLYKSEQKDICADDGLHICMGALIGDFLSAYSLQAYLPSTH